MFWTTTFGVTATLTGLVIMATCTTGERVRETQEDPTPATDSPFVLDPQSTVELTGGATIGSWGCTSERVNGAIAPDADAQAIAAALDRLEQNPELELSIPEDYAFTTHLRVPVESFDCGNRDMEQDMHEALKMAEHPTIEYGLATIDAVTVIDDEDDPSNALRLRTRGELTLAGAQRDIEMDVIARRTDDGRWTLLGRKKLKMTDFDVTPPSALLGLIRARDTVEVVFDLVVRQSPSD